MGHAVGYEGPGETSKMRLDLRQKSITVYVTSFKSVARRVSRKSRRLQGSQDAGIAMRLLAKFGISSHLAVQILISPRLTILPLPPPHTQ